MLRVLVGKSALSRGDIEIVTKGQKKVTGEFNTYLQAPDKNFVKSLGNRSRVCGGGKQGEKLKRLVKTVNAKRTKTFQLFNTY